MVDYKGRCMKCKKEQTMVKAVVVRMKTGVRAAKGSCPKCGTKMFRFIGK